MCGFLLCNSTGNHDKKYRRKSGFNLLFKGKKGIM